MTTRGFQNDVYGFMECPSEVTLLEFTQLTLPSIINDQVRDHVQRCRMCQERLDRLTDSPRLRGDSHETSENTANDLEQDGAAHRIIQSLCATAGIELQETNAPAPVIQLSPPVTGQSLGTLSHYVIRRELGSGGTATVFEAIDSRNGQRVALKFIRGGDAATLRRAEREARAISQLAHPNIVSIQAVEVTEDGRLFLVMPLISGRSLSDVLSGRLKPDYESSCRIILQIADALVTVHSLRLIHRDIKPGNILVDENGIARLTDFGLASFVDEDSSLTETGVAVGTPCYMSPEQASDGQSVDFRSDIYSLGATLYECITGLKPFRGSTADVIRQVLNSDPESPRRINPEVPPELETICLKAMNKEANRRYENAQAMLSDLRRWVDQEPIAAKPAGSIEKLLLWVRRNPAAAALSSALIVSIVGGAAGVVWNWRQAVRERDIAQNNLRQTMQAVDQFYLKISQPRAALDQPGFQTLRQELTQEAVEFYELFLKEWPDDPVLNEELANARLSLAEMTESLGVNDKSVAAWRKAAEAVEVMRLSFPDEQRWQDVLYGCHFHEANGLTQANDLNNAILAYQKVQVRVKELHNLKPAELKYRRDLASCEGSLGNCLLRLDRFEEAARHYRSAADIFRTLRTEDPSNPDLTMKLVTTMTNLAMCLEAKDQIPVYEEARGYLLSLAEDPPTALFARRLAKIDLCEGEAAVALSQKEQAVRLWCSGVDTLKPHVDANPAVNDYRDLLGHLYFLLGSHVDSKEDAFHYLKLAIEHQTVLCKSDPSLQEYKDNLHETQQILEQRSK